MTLTPARRLLLVALALAAVAWLVGPPSRMAVALIVLLLGPGYLLGVALLPPPREPLIVRLALYLGLSLSLIPLLYQWLTFAGLSLPTPLLLIVTGLVVCASTVLLWRGARSARPQPPAPSSPSWANLALVAICGLTLWARFAEIENLALPAWVDSVHHALMVRVAAEQGRAPLSLLPYMPISGLPYHWGYHVVIGAVVQLSGLRVDRALLWSGQILNALHAPAAAALAMAFWRRPLAGVVAALVVGLISYMPAYYVSWGRYTQLTGLLILPALAIAWQQALASNRWRWWATAAILLAGLSLVHFRVLIFSLALLGVLSLVWAVQHGLGPALSRLRGAVLSALAAIALSAPWLILIAQRTLFPAIARPQNLIIDGGYNALRPELLWIGQNPTLISLALLAALWGCWRRAPAALALLGWVAALVLMASPALLTAILPACGVGLILLGAKQLRGPRKALACGALIGGAGLLLVNPWFVQIPAIYLITFDAVLISLYLPIAVLIGGGAAALYAHLTDDGRRWTVDGSADGGRWTVDGALESARRTDHDPLSTVHRPPSIANAVAILLLAGTSIWGAYQLRDVLNQNTVIASSADLAAVEWVAVNTPPDARFLINATGWIGATDRGVDGGWWLLPLTGRWTSTPPALFIYGQLDYVAEVQARSRTVINYKPGDEQIIRDLIARERIGYLYFGSKPGPLTAATFAALPGFTTVYSQDGVTILAVNG